MPRLIDLSRVIEAGPGPVICDYWSLAASAENYEDGSTFQIGLIDIVASTGSYLDSLFHRHADDADLAELDLARLAQCNTVVVRQPYVEGLAIDTVAFDRVECCGRAVLVATGWDLFWRIAAYFDDHSFLTEAAARHLAAAGAVLVGIDSRNIDDTRTRLRPVHTILLRAGIPICEHLTKLDALPTDGFRFGTVRPKIASLETFPVRAFATLPG